MIRRFRSYSCNRAGLALAAVLCSIVGVLVASAPALAVFTRPYLSQLPEVPVTAPVPGPIGNPGGVAVDPVNGAVYVSSRSTSTIDEFDSTGSFLSQLTGEGHFSVSGYGNGGLTSLAVDGATGDLYVNGAFLNGGTGNTPVDVFDSTGVFVSELVSFYQSSLSDAVDQSTGDIYVASSSILDGGTNPVYPVVYRYDSSNNPVAFAGRASYISGNEITGTPNGRFEAVSSTGAITNLATDSNGNLYILGSAVYEYNSNGIFVREFGGGGTGIAIDPTNGDILIATGGSIAEYDSSGRFLNTITGTSPSAPFGRADGVAVSPTGYVYVADANNNVVDVFGHGVFLPDVTARTATEKGQTSATLNGEVDPESITVTNCHFEYVTDTAFHATGFSDLSSGGEAPCVPSIPADSSFHAVHAAVTGLASGVNYRFRLVATTLDGTTGSAALPFLTLHAPTVDATSFANLLSTFADLHAEINPHGVDTTYQFEYVDAAHYNAGAQDPYSAGGTAPASPIDIGSAGADASVLQQVGGLLPNTTYHFRAVATNALGVTFGPDDTFTTLPETIPGLPDGRAYELVTPPNKGDAEDMFGEEGTGHTEGVKNSDFGYSSEDGNGFLFWTAAAFGPFPPSGEGSYVFSRGASGWRFTSLASPNLGVQSLFPSVYNPVDFSQVGLTDFVGPTGTPVENLLGPPGGPYATIYINSGGPNSPEKGEFVGASSNLSHVVLESMNHAIAPGDANQDPGSNALYEEVGGKLRLVNVNTNGSLTSRCGAVLGVSSQRAGGTHDAVSSDGSKIFFTSPDPLAYGFHCWNKGSPEGSPPEVYARVDGERTVEVSAPDPGVKDPLGMQLAVFVGASADGSKVFFLTSTELTADDKTHGTELYEYDTVTSTLTRVSRGESGSTDGNVSIVPAISSDGSTVYFMASGQLAAGAPVGGGLYRYDTNTGVTRYVSAGGGYPGFQPGEWYGGHVALTVRENNWYTTPEGRFLLFGSAENITGYNSNGHTELYRYDSSDGSIVCVSCDPNGAPPISDALFSRSAVRADNPAGTPPRPISNDGEYAFFDTAEPLVPQDTNSALDVYEWHDGVISLISSGTDPRNTFFLDSSADGSNVFFGTHVRLVPQDTDSSGDLYDARIGGGFRVFAGTGQCEGDACQNPGPSPIDQTPASLTFSGLGNPASEPVPAVKAKTKAKTKKKKTKHKKKAKKAKKSVARRSRNAGRARHAGTTGRAGK
jgi:cell division septation protein DedD